MAVHPAEVRIDNLFVLNNQVIEFSIWDMQNLHILAPFLTPILITPFRLSRLHFDCQNQSSPEHRYFSRLVKGQPLRLMQEKYNYACFLNSQELAKLSFIHQLQNLYYDLTGEILRRDKPVPPNASGLL